MFLKKMVIFTLLFSFSVCLAVHASFSPSSHKDVSIHRKDNWRRAGISDIRRNTSDVFFVQVGRTKTMWSVPNVRMVNSNNAVRSDTLRLTSTNKTFDQRGNDGAKGYRYYLQIKPAWNQIDSDTISLKFDAN